MAKIQFYTKPGCIGAQKQKDILMKSGHDIEEYSIFEETWTPELLKRFFKDKKIEEWYNPYAPQVTAKEVIPGARDEEDSLREICRNPILIHRPLMIIEGQYFSGFNPEELGQIIPLDIDDGVNPELCQQPETNVCPSPKS